MAEGVRRTLERMVAGRAVQHHDSWPALPPRQAAQLAARVTLAPVLRLGTSPAIVSPLRTNRLEGTKLYHCRAEIPKIKGVSGFTRRNYQATIAGVGSCPRSTSRKVKITT
jgi:hypothetical protein